MPMTKSQISTNQHIINAKGLACPLPLLKLKMGLKDLAKGEKIRVLTTDSASVKDFSSYCELSGHQLEIQQKRAYFEFIIEKG